MTLSPQQRDELRRLLADELRAAWQAAAAHHPQPAQPGQSAQPGQPSSVAGIGNRPQLRLVGEAEDRPLAAEVAVAEERLRAVEERRRAMRSAAAAARTSAGERLAETDVLDTAETDEPS